jgi:hypothetical protein
LDLRWFLLQLDGVMPRDFRLVALSEKVKIPWRYCMYFMFYSHEIIFASAFEMLQFPQAVFPKQFNPSVSPGK